MIEQPCLKLIPYSQYTVYVSGIILLYHTYQVMIPTLVVRVTTFTRLQLRQIWRGRRILIGSWRPSLKKKDRGSETGLSVIKVFIDKQSGGASRHVPFQVLGTKRTTAFRVTKGSHNLIASHSTEDAATNKTMLAKLIPATTSATRLLACLELCHTATVGANQSYGR